MRRYRRSIYFDCDCFQRCAHCTRSNPPCMTTAMKFTHMPRSGILSKFLIILVTVGTISLIYFARPLHETHVSRSYVSSNDVDDEGETGKKDDAAGIDYEVQSEFVGVEPQIVDSAKKNSGVINSLRAIIGLGSKDNGGKSSKAEINFDSHAEHLLETLDLNLYKNESNTTRHVAGISPSKKSGIHLLSPDEEEITGGDHPRCIPGKTRDRMLNLFGSGYDVNIQPFVGKETTVSGLMSLPPPFGFRKSESALKKTLSVVEQSDFPKILGTSCTRCVVVGNGGVMKQSAMGSTIDEFDVVIRLNDAPIYGYESDVGTKTTIRMGYPESSFQSSILYQGHWLYVLVIFKQTDLQWTADVASGKKASATLHFWKSVARSVPKPADEFRIFNPLIIRETAELIGLKVGNGKMGKNVPTTGSFAISMATRLCDEVSVAGFGYEEGKPLHYYDSKQMKLVKNSWTHNIDVEKKWLHKLVQQGTIHDLTHGIK